jgi:hypothetical protein
MSWLDDLEDRVNDLLNVLERIAGATERIADAAEAEPENTDALRQALGWIADATHVGNYAPLEVIEIHRKWAANALERTE